MHDGDKEYDEDDLYFDKRSKTYKIQSDLYKFREYHRGKR